MSFYKFTILLLVSAQLCGAPLRSDRTEKTAAALLEDFAVYYQFAFPAHERAEAARQDAIAIIDNYNSAARVMAKIIDFLGVMSVQEQDLLREYGDRIKTPAHDTFEALRKKAKQNSDDRYDQFRNWAIEARDWIILAKIPEEKLQAGKGYFTRDFQYYLFQLSGKQKLIPKPREQNRKELRPNLPMAPAAPFPNQNPGKQKVIPNWANRPRLGTH